MNIISASRRTDIPAFFMPWFMNRLKAGFAEYPNPFNGKLVRVSLKPEAVHSVIFWSKNYKPFLNYIKLLENSGYNYSLHYTLTALPSKFEPKVPTKNEAIKTFEALAKQIKPEQVFWRYDPIYLNNDLTPFYYLKSFEHLAKELCHFTQHCFISFIQPYRNVLRRFKFFDLEFQESDIHIKKQMVRELNEIAKHYDISLKVCSQDELLENQELKASCIDGNYLNQLFPEKPLINKKSPSRKSCGCTISKDIGVYGTCAHGCVYCYANQGRMKLPTNGVNCDPESSVLKYH